jgi:hypothetical protein
MDRPDIREKIMLTTRRLLLASIALSTLSMTPAYAQDAEAEGAEEGEEIIVTARRQEEPRSRY